VFAVQDEIAKRVTEALSVALTGGSPWGYMPEEQAMSLSKRAAMRAVEIAPDFGLAEARLARTLSLLGTEGVAEHYERALVLSPGDPEVIRLYVNYLRDENRSGEALKLLEPVLAVEPRDPRLRGTYAMLLDSNGDVPGSLRQFREVIRLRPDYVVPYLYAAITTERSLDGADLSLRLYRHAASLDEENATLFSRLSLLYRRVGEDQLALRAERELQRLGATGDLRWSRVYAATVARRPEEARMLVEQILRESPQEAVGLFGLSRYPGTPEEYREALELTMAGMTANAQQAGTSADAQVRLNIWLGDETAALDALARWEPVWRSRHAFGLIWNWARMDFLARSLACVGRKDDALTELEALITEGYNMDWHAMAIDPAYDTIRGEPRFKAVSDQLKAADAAARKRFRARPDLNDADIESLGM
jgi:tetratricopeptide (TPR) repeat protein